MFDTCIYYIIINYTLDDENVLFYHLVLHLIVKFEISLIKYRLNQGKELGSMKLVAFIRRL